MLKYQVWTAYEAHGGMIQTRIEWKYTFFTVLNVILWICKNPAPGEKSSSINPGPGAAVEWKTPLVARGGGDVGAWNWLMHNLQS